MSAQEFYRAQSEMSDPGAYDHLYDALPNDIGALCQAVRNVYVHYMDKRHKIPVERKAEIDTRRCDRILERIITLDVRPLNQRRPSQARFVGCCRDAALLLCSMLRHKGIPARLRAGFSTYFNTPNFNPDHVIIEYFDRGRWVLVDPELETTPVTSVGDPFDAQDIPRNRFFVAGDVWQACRSGQADADMFGATPSDSFWRGMWAIRSRMLDDLAMLNKMEYLIWDSWGLKDYGTPDESELALLERVATLTSAAHDDSNFDALRRLYKHEQLRAPRAFTSYSPVRGEQFINLADL